MDFNVRDGKTIIYKDGSRMKCDSIGLAKKESFKLQQNGKGLGRGDVLLGKVKIKPPVKGGVDPILTFIKRN